MTKSRISAGELIANFWVAKCMYFEDAKKAAKIHVDKVIELLDDMEYTERGKVSNGYGQNEWREIKTEIDAL